MYFVLRAFLFLFDAEWAHHFVLKLLSISWLRNLMIPKQPRLPHLGLAAGLDKNGVALEAWDRLGFGFVEIGTVTPRPQVGNPKPRLFRMPRDQALFNRMGFNNEGAEKIAEQLRKTKPQLSPDFRIGINIGKNKETPAEQAVQDYLMALKPFISLVDFVVVNVSSPNTPGLRELQSEEFLIKLFQELRAQTYGTSLELFCKLAPEIDLNVLKQFFQGPLQELVDGWVLSNTLGGNGPDGIPGGISGLPIQTLARKRLEEARKLTSKKIISVGGLMNSQDYLERMSLGAFACEIYTGFIYKGPRLLSKIRAALESR